MKRIVTFVLAAVLLAWMMAALPVAAFAVLPTPADGQKAAITAFLQMTYEYPVGSGEWYFDGNVMNETASRYAAGVPAVRPVVTLEYLDASDNSVGTQAFALPINVMPCDNGTGTFRPVHLAQTLPAGAIPTKTRFAVEVDPSDPEYPKYHYGIAEEDAAYGDIYGEVGNVDDTTLGGGRTQFTVTVTNTTGRYVGPVRVGGNEAAGLSGSSAETVDTWEVTPNEPLKARRLAPGDSTTFQARGLAPTPAGLLRWWGWNLFFEGEPLNDLLGIVTGPGGLPLAGVTVSVPDCPPVNTAADGTYRVVGVIAEPQTVTFSKADFVTKALSVTPSYSADAILNASLDAIPDEPTAVIDSVSPSTAAVGSAVSFAGHLGADAYDHAALAYAWRSSIDGPLSTAASFSTTGLSVGTHTIYFKVTCAGGATSPEVSRTIVVAIPDEPTAVIDLVSPSTATFGSAVSFAGHLVPDAYGHAALTYSWRSSIDGPLPTGASFSTSALSVGTHTKYFQVTCAGGATSPEVSTTVVINAPAPPPPPAPSPPVAVAVGLGTPKVSGKASAKKGTKLVGTVVPAHSARVRIVVEVLKNKKYRAYKKYWANSSANGAWTYKMKVKRGTYRVRTLTYGDATHLAGTSKWRKVVVK